MEANASAAPHVPAFYQRYLDQAGSDDPVRAMEWATRRWAELFAAIPEERAGHRYAPGKWSIAELVQHVIDSERVFAYRALRFARGDSTPLPGFDEDTFAAASRADRRSLSDLLTEHDAVRTASLLLFRSFDDTVLARTGTANGTIFSVRGLGLILAGHAAHHLHILQHRYLDHGHP